jgi:KaiC/GvpD/RAD55 family RecA-like ATPase
LSDVHTSKDQGLDDLHKFVNVGNRSLLIKGKSGTGKATLCFELAKAHIDKFDVVFISRKTSEQALYKRFPWVRSFVRPQNVISITSTDFILADPSFTITNIINSITNFTTKIEDPFVSLNERTKPFVILDVWDGITKEVDATTRIRAEKMLTSLIDRNEGFIIFLTEDLTNSTIEYLVDGVIFLTQLFYKSYRLREMEIQKLKGTHISRAKVPFTLEGGRFRTFSKISHKISVIDEAKQFAAVPDKEGHYSTGNITLDERLNGGFKQGSIISIDIGEEVDRFAFVPILAPPVLNFIAQNNAAIVIPASDQYASAVSKYILPHADDDKIRKYLRIFSGGGSRIQPASPPPYLFFKIEKTFAETYKNWMEVYRKLKEETSGCILTLDFSFVELEYQNEIQSILKSIIELSRIIRISNDLVIMISRPNYKSLDVMMNVSDIHLRIFEYNGVTMLAAIKPQLFLFNIQLDYSRGFPTVVLREST